MDVSTEVRTEATEGYVVVFEYSEAAGGYAGIRTQTQFASQAEFDREFAAHGQMIDGKKLLGEEIVVGEGITQEEALELIHRVPITAYARAAACEATDPSTGQVNSEIAKIRMMTAMIARRSLGPPYIF